MTQTKFTPGPWLVGEGEDTEITGKWFPIRDKDNKLVALVPAWDHPIEETIANAHHLTAQELYFILEGIVHFGDAVAYRNDPLSTALRGWIAEGEVALAKARGEMP